ncbi:MAG: hypothetical protein IH808_12225 [Proteobacteria bacterium]|nr:hypothetical protein [Pseudomonadota bacterium]
MAVLPFRITGDASLDYLRDGMVEFLTTRLTGEGGPQAADPSVVASALAPLVESDDDEL